MRRIQLLTLFLAGLLWLGGLPVAAQSARHHHPNRPFRIRVQPANGQHLRGAQQKSPAGCVCPPPSVHRWSTGGRSQAKLSRAVTLLFARLHGARSPPRIASLFGV